MISMEEIARNHCKNKQIAITQPQAPPRRKALPPKPHNNAAGDVEKNNKLITRINSGRSVDGQQQLKLAEQMKLAALAISFNIQLRSADMPSAMQERALRHTRAVLDSAAADHRRPNLTILARSLKKEFDSVYGPAWHCVVGKSFGSFVTHSRGGFVYFSVDSLSFLLFKTEVHLIPQKITK